MKAINLKDLQKIFSENIISKKYSEDLLNNIIPAGNLDKYSAMQVYSEDYFARMQDALGKNYEATWLLLGDETFSDLAMKYISKFPSSLKNLTLYGDEFVSFLEEIQLHEEIPDIIIQMAQFEKSYWDLFHLEDKFPLVIDQHTLESKRFNLRNIKLIKSNYYLDLIFSKRESRMSEIANNMEYFVKNDNFNFYALYRNQFGVVVEKISNEAFLLLTELSTVKNILNLQTQVNDPNHWAMVFKCLLFSSFE